MNEYRLRQFLEQNGIRDEIELMDALSHAKAITQLAGGRLLPKHVDLYITQQQAMHLGAEDLAAVQRLCQLFLKFQAQEAPAPSPPQFSAAPTIAPPPERGTQWGRLIGYAIVIALVVAGALNLKRLKGLVISQASGGDFSAERERLPNLLPSTVPENDPKAKECLAGMLVAKVAYSDARADCYADREARKVQESGRRMSKGEFESYLREQSKLRGNDTTFTSLEIEAGPPAPREGRAENTVVLYVRAFTSDHRPVRGTGALTYKLVSGGQTVQKTVQINGNDYTTGNDPAVRIIVDVPFAKKNDTAVDVDVTLGDRMARSIRYSF